MAQATITGLFDSRAAAERAVEYMVQHHDIAREAVRVHAAGEENVAAGTHDRRSEDHHGFVAREAAGDDVAPQGLPGGLPQEEREALAEAMPRAGIMVTATVPDARREEAMRAFTENGAVEVAVADPGATR
ncbi:MAG: hypothetical protein K2X74_05825 [Acetobacteraceae bacterium]|nr:hypothetical protein [Acetobacteraceae bacterium]